MYISVRVWQAEHHDTEIWFTMFESETSWLNILMKIKCI